MVCRRSKFLRILPSMGGTGERKTDEKKKRMALSTLKRDIPTYNAVLVQQTLKVLLVLPRLTSRFRSVATLVRIAQFLVLCCFLWSHGRPPSFIFYKSDRPSTWACAMTKSIYWQSTTVTDILSDIARARLSV